MPMVSAVQLEEDIAQIMRDYTGGHIGVREARRRLLNRSKAVSAWLDGYADVVGQERADHVERIMRVRTLRYSDVLQAKGRDYTPGRFRSVRTFEGTDTKYYVPNVLDYEVTPVNPQVKNAV